MEPTAILDGDPAAVEIVTGVRREEVLLKAGTLQNAIFNSANFSRIAADERGVLQIFNVGVERWCRGYPIPRDVAFSRRAYFH
jgi:hypothetical protein